MEAWNHDHVWVLSAFGSGNAVGKNHVPEWLTTNRKTSTRYPLTQIKAPVDQSAECYSVGLRSRVPMNKLSNYFAVWGDRAHGLDVQSNQTQPVCISAAQFAEIEKAGQTELSDELRAEIEIVLNSYISRHGWDRDTRPSKEKKVHLKLLSKHVRGLLQALDDVNRKFSGGGDFHTGIALDDQSIFNRAGIHSVQLIAELQSLATALDDDKVERDRGGRPSDLFLPQCFCELEEIYIKAGRHWVGVTKTLNDTRESPFADFVNAILRFAPAGYGPSSSPGVAVAWERQLRSRRVFNL
jgi:hypothetical protein